MRVVLLPSQQTDKKYVAIFTADGVLAKWVHFGARGYEDYTTHGDENRKRLYLLRHQHEDWTNPLKPGALARYILWNKPTIAESLADYKERFGFV